VKSWCGFQHTRGPSYVNATWDDQIKAYIVAPPLDLRPLTQSQVDLIILFTRSFSPVKQRIEFIKHHQHAGDVSELMQLLQILVKDSAKKQGASHDRQIDMLDGCAQVVEPLG